MAGITQQHIDDAALAADWRDMGEEADWTLDCRDWVKVEAQR